MVDGSWNGPHWRKTGFPSMGEPTASPTVQSTERVLQKSDRSESLGQVPIDPDSGLAKLACRRFFFFAQDPKDAQTHLVSNRDSMQYACVRYGGREVVVVVVAVDSIRKNPRVDRGELPRFLLRVFHRKGFPCQ